MRAAISRHRRAFLRQSAALSTVTPHTRWLVVLSLAALGVAGARVEGGARCVIVMRAGVVVLRLGPNRGRPGRMPRRPGPALRPNTEGNEARWLVSAVLVDDADDLPVARIDDDNVVVTELGVLIALQRGR